MSGALGSCSALEAADDRQLILVSAPAGYGKTSLVADWISSLGSEEKTAWVTFEDRDEGFWQGLVGCLESLGVETSADRFSHAGARVDPRILTALASSVAGQAHDCASSSTAMTSSRTRWVAISTSSSGTAAIGSSSSSSPGATPCCRSTATGSRTTSRSCACATSPSPTMRHPSCSPRPVWSCRGARSRRSTNGPRAGPWASVRRRHAPGAGGHRRCGRRGRRRHAATSRSTSWPRSWMCRPRRSGGCC